MGTKRERHTVMSVWLLKTEVIEIIQSDCNTIMLWSANLLYLDPYDCACSNAV